MSLVFRRAIVVGASSGIGAEIARQLDADGCAVALLGRREDELNKVAAAITSSGRGSAIVKKHDVTHTDTVPALLDELVKQLGGLDLLVYASGIMFTPGEGEYDFAQDRAQIEVNLIGGMAWTNPVCAMFEAQRSGTIVGISSIAGERGRRTFPGYSTSKAAFTTWLEGLRNKASRYGVNVVTVKPGFVDTPMTTAIERKPMVIPASKAAELILSAAKGGGSPSVFVPGQWWLVAMILRHIPSFLFRKLSI
ncbi:MAG: SDR family NAD(P)-dependent oxidoreductase [Candidatus Eisenbacteria bacterium]|nr:SDR family NAD(P)-dependent oxidoreductase [Candidatus Eisenbacteria bacterium]